MNKEQTTSRPPSLSDGTDEEFETFVEIVKCDQWKPLPAVRNTIGEFPFSKGGWVYWPDGSMMIFGEFQVTKWPNWKTLLEDGDTPIMIR